MSLDVARYFRVDPRLVHATTMNVWVPTTGAKSLLVVDSEVAEDHRRRVILELSAMGAVDVRFSDETNANFVLSESPNPALVLFSTLESVERAVDAGLEVDRLNIGHLPEAPGRMPVHPAVHIGPRDLEVVHRLEGRGIEVFVQPLPTDKAQPAIRQRPSMAPPSAKPTKALATVRVVNAKGLHLRAAHLLAHLAGTLPCEVHIGLQRGDPVNAKSLLGLTTLGAGCGTLLEVSVEGFDSQQSMDQIKTLFASGFEEGVDWTPDQDK
jgi:phosphotransferase system HPr (HPr) family protein